MDTLALRGRRRFLLAAGALAATPLLGRAASAPAGLALSAAPASAAIAGAGYPDTAVWAFGGRVPGPVLRVRQGERFRVAFANHLPEDSTVHWHGVRVPNAMDGVPHLTQPPVAPGATFAYEFVAPDAGTFWYHPHSRSYEQVERGLAGALVVAEGTPPDVDRDEVWVLDDWRLARDAALLTDFLDYMDASHAGRLGNTVTVNGTVPERFELRSGERLRLRLVNAANARTFGLRFTGHRPWVMALDGHPVAPHEPPRGVVVVGASQRVDLFLDAVGRPGERHEVQDVFYPRQAYRLLDLAYADAPPLATGRGSPPPALAPNPLPQPDLSRAQHHEVVLSGGMMSMDWPEDPWPARAARRVRNWLGAREPDPIWAINGVAITGDSHVHEPAIAVRRGTSVVMDFRNRTAWPHPMHLHGHAFRVLERNGRPNPLAEWRDTILLGPRERARVAFVADNPGDWMLHCHILEHQATGMMATMRVE